MHNRRKLAGIDKLLEVMAEGSVYLDLTMASKVVGVFFRRPTTEDGECVYPTGRSWRGGAVPG